MEYRYLSYTRAIEISIIYDIATDKQNDYTYVHSIVDISYFLSKASKIFSFLRFQVSRSNFISDF